MFYLYNGTFGPVSELSSFMAQWGVGWGGGGRGGEGDGFQIDSRLNHSDLLPLHPPPPTPPFRECTGQTPPPPPPPPHDTV